MSEQNYSNHRRWYPLFHFVVMPLLALNFLSHLIRFFMAPSWALAFWTLLGITLILLALVSRLQSLKAQDRVIRLEERLRYRDVLSPELAERAKGLRTGQVIALRFASDEELPQLIERTLNGEFAKPKEIKQAIKNWRGDHLRV
ncbi:MAG: DUF6526 family protein [Pyrinomonadaceae bacterium]